MRLPEDVTETFSRRLALIRRDRGLTQEQLGLAVGESRQTITHWENDPGFEPRLSDVNKCARALRCRPKDLLAPLDAPIARRPRFRWIIDATGAPCPRPIRRARLTAWPPA
jgi:transcriptional regulator with XRE-family HTH domain